ncbi:hypothetical protein GCM10023185_06610 [Hymenobacter saemangeumensis]|uniref:Peptidase M28 domain-containing protein n=1 Tax=Hymenobacter saemangeumensis TaxID=1084522 RepID=A0ABP8I1X1_9BACT
MNKPTLFAFALLLAGGTVAAQPAKSAGGKVKPKSQAAVTISTPAAPAPLDWSLTYAASITPEALRQDLEVLASDAYEGRKTGEKGQKMAADYLANAFAAAGLTGPMTGAANPYLQQFTLNRVALDAAATTLQLGGKTYRGNADFHAILNAAFERPQLLQPAFVGYGIVDEKYADFVANTQEYKGKDLVLLMGEPLNAKGEPLLGTDGKPSPYAALDLKGIGARQRHLMPLGARSITFILPSAEAFATVPANFKRALGREEIEFDGKASDEHGFNGLLVSPELGARMLGTTVAGLDKYRKAVAKAGKPLASPFTPAAATLRAVRNKVPFTTENVLGYLEGSDKKEELIVVSAHYDHLGMKDGKVMNGADDDGSGTVSVLAMARAFSQAKKDGHGPRRSLLFLANTGEEAGLLGSQYYTENPVFPLANTVTNLNIDMIGRVDEEHAGKGDYLYLVGADKLSSELHALSEATNQQYNPLALDYKYNDPNDPERIYYRSDHYNFAKNGIPVIFYTSGDHDDYHKSTDDVDKIDFPAMARRDHLIFHTAWALAQRETRVAVDSNKP